MAHPPRIQRSGPTRFPGRRVLRGPRSSGSPLDPRLALLLLGVLATPLAGQQYDGDPGARNTALAALFARYDRPDSPGCIVGVGERGGIAYRNGFGMANLEHDIPMTPFTISEIGSVSKQFTAAALVLLAQDGHLSLDDEVRRHDPPLPDFGARSPSGSS
jgi:CubicO group peptidase (beta-lactamase class C family)